MFASGCEECDVNLGFGGLDIASQSEPFLSSKQNIDQQLSQFAKDCLQQQ